MKKQNAWIDNEGWCRCGRCRRRLFYVSNWGHGNGNGFVVLEIKCHSCKEVNEISLYA